MRDGLGPARLRMHGGVVADEFGARFGPEGRAKVLAGEVVTADGTVVEATTVLAPGSHVYLYRDLPDEVPVPFDIPVLHRDDDIVVVDKPHFLATMPRGRHVAQTALVRLRRELDLPELSPAHRLDRLTAGVLLFTVRREVRGAYQTLFAHGLVQKTYLAVAQGIPDVELPAVVRNRIVKRRGVLQATVEPGEPNAETLVESLGRRALPVDSAYRAHASVARTHVRAGRADRQRPALSRRHRRCAGGLFGTFAAAGGEPGVRRSAVGATAPVRQRRCRVELLYTCE